MQFSLRVQVYGQDPASNPKWELLAEVRFDLAVTVDRRGTLVELSVNQQ
jgi:hypothetical protein